MRVSWLESPVSDLHVRMAREQGADERLIGAMRSQGFVRMDAQVLDSLVVNGECLLVVDTCYGGALVPAGEACFVRET